MEPQASSAHPGPDPERLQGESDPPGRGAGDDQGSPLSADEMVVLRALRPAFNVMMRRFDAELSRLHALSHTEYLVLMSLADVETMRLTELAAACQQSISATSRTISRLETAGLVRRQQAPHDARSFDVALTDEGRRRFVSAQADHLVNVQHTLFSHLDGVDIKSLGRALAAIAGQPVDTLNNR